MGMEGFLGDDRRLYCVLYALLIVDGNIGVI